MNDQIHIAALEIWAHVGVADEERAQAQRLVFNITFWSLRDSSKIKDDLSQTVDYAAVCAEAKAFVQGRRDRLIETLADRLALHLLDVFAIRQVTVEVRKFVLPAVEFVSVTVTRPPVE